MPFLQKKKNKIYKKRFIKYGGDCTPAQLVDPDTVCPISQELLSEIEPEYRVSINGVCYDARSLCDWLSLPESRERDGLGNAIPDNDWNNFHNNYCPQIRYRLPPLPLPPAPAPVIPVQMNINNNNNQWDFNNHLGGKLSLRRKKRYFKKKISKRS